MHAYVIGIKCSPTSIFLAELNLAIEDSIFIKGARKFQAK